MRERVLAIVSLIAQYFLEEQEMMSENDLVVTRRSDVRVMGTRFTGGEREA